MRQPLTKRQRQTLEAIVEHLRLYHRPPVIRWLCERLGLSSTNAANDFLNGLERRGCIKRYELKSAGIRVTQRGFDEVGGCCPFCGHKVEEQSAVLDGRTVKGGEMKLSEEIRGWSTSPEPFVQGLRHDDVADWADRVAELEDLLAQGERDRARLLADCAQMSSEFGLPPTVRPAEGEIKARMEELEGGLRIARAALMRIRDGASHPVLEARSGLVSVRGFRAEEEVETTTFTTDLFSTPSDLKGAWGPVKLEPNTRYRVAFVRCDDE